MYYQLDTSKNIFVQTKARNAMEAIWNYRESKNDLVGTTINVQNGEWSRKGTHLLHMILLMYVCI